jgi:hypothetical protein
MKQENFDSTKQEKSLLFERVVKKQMLFLFFFAF